MSNKLLLVLVKINHLPFVRSTCPKLLMWDAKPSCARGRYSLCFLMPDIRLTAIWDCSCTALDTLLEYLKTRSFAGSFMNLLTSAPAQANIAWSSSPAKYISSQFSLNLSYSCHCNGDKSWASSIKIAFSFGILPELITFLIRSLKSNRCIFFLYSCRFI